MGKGAFGKVRIVERKDTGLTFALKYIRKDEGRLPFFRLLRNQRHILTALTSRPVGECAEHYSRAAHAGTS